MSSPEYIFIYKYICNIKCTIKRTLYLLQPTAFARQCRSHPYDGHRAPQVSQLPFFLQLLLSLFRL